MLVLDSVKSLLMLPLLTSCLVAAALRLAYQDALTSAQNNFQSKLLAQQVRHAAEHAQQLTAASPCCHHSCQDVEEETALRMQRRKHQQDNEKLTVRLLKFAVRRTALPNSLL
jgi:hypothetical protein